MPFKNKLQKIKEEIIAFTNNKDTLMAKFVKRKLDRSLENYLAELNINVDYLLYRDNKKVIKYIDKTIAKEKNEDE